MSFVNNSVVHVDGSKAMTGILTLPASNPTSSNQATRKAYVDAGDSTNATAAAAALAAANLKAKASGSSTAVAPHGTAAPTWSSTQLLIQGGEVDSETNAAGDFTITFPTAFPTACLAVVVVSAISDRNYYYAVHDTGTKSAVAVRVWQHDGSALASASTRVNYIAIGW